MEQDQSEEDREQVEAWAEVAVEEEWVVIAREQGPAETVFAQVAARECLISKECLVTQ